ncbi:MAG: rod shape-determining protein MreD [Legionella sp.]
MTNVGLRLTAVLTAALVLSILPMPELFHGFRPPWILLLLLYVEYYLPNKFNICIILFIGLLLDVLLATVIGEHSFALLFTTWIASSKARRFQFFSMLQQICLIGFFCFMYQFLISLIDGLLGFNYSIYMSLASAGLGMFFWPWLRLLGDSMLLTRITYR